MVQWQHLFLFYLAVVQPPKSLDYTGDISYETDDSHEVTTPEGIDHILSSPDSSDHDITGEDSIIDDHNEANNYGQRRDSGVGASLTRTPRYKTNLQF